MTAAHSENNTKYYYNLALSLAVFTILYNIAEGLICTMIGYTEESITLFGFGVDSFIETISGIGIFHMVLRIRSNPSSKRDDYERTALRITGYSFFALTAGLVSTGIYNFSTGQQPSSTFYGFIISLISILIMLVLVHYKTKTGKALNSDAILADAQCTKVCIYMSVVLLAASGLYYFFSVPYMDSLGALALAYLSFKEGQECFQKAKSDKLCACDHD